MKYVAGNILTKAEKNLVRSCLKNGTCTGQNSETEFCVIDVDGPLIEVQVTTKSRLTSEYIYKTTLVAFLKSPIAQPNSSFA